MLVGAGFLAHAVRGLARGELRFGGQVYARAARPLLYWYYTVLLAAVGLVALGYYGAQLMHGR